MAEIRKVQIDALEYDVVGKGMPSGGTEGQVLTKVSGSDYDTEWADPSGSSGGVYYGVCSTDQSTGTKIVTIDGISELYAGLEIVVRFQYPNQADWPMLNVNNLGAYHINTQSLALPTFYAEPGEWPAGAVLHLVYDGYYWVITGRSHASTNFYGATKLYSGLDSSDNGLAATAGAVKALNDAKLDADQGTSNAGKYLVVGSDGGIVPSNNERVLPSGGRAGQVLKKATNSDFIVEWANESGDGNSLPAGGTSGQILAKASNDNYDVEWITPSGGGGTGTDDYSGLSNKPQINGLTLTGNKTSEELGLAQAQGLKWNQGNINNGSLNPSNKKVIYSDPIPVQPGDVIHVSCKASGFGYRLHLSQTDDPTTWVAWPEVSDGDYYVLSSSTTARVLRLRVGSNDTDINPAFGNRYFSVRVMQPEDLLAPTGDYTDRSTVIEALLKRHGVCHLASGDFYITDGIDMPDGSELCGSGTSTQLILDTLDAGYCVKMGSHCTVRDLAFAGQEADVVLNDPIHDRHGVLWRGDYSSSGNKNTQPKYGTINNCFFRRFTGGAITCDDTGPAVEHGLNVSDVQIEGCNAGINIAYYSEYHRFTNVIAYGCKYGCVNNGGNNVFVNCGFSNNKVGFIVKMVDNSDRAITNNTHGSAIGCVFNHCDRDDTTLGKGNAVHIEGGMYGFVFSGCQFFYSAIYLKDSRGVSFNGCNIGPMKNLSGDEVGLAIIVETTDATTSRKHYFTGCVFSREPVVTYTDTSGQTRIIWTGCYTRTGTAIGGGGGSGGAVDSVNGQTGTVVLDASDVGAYELPSGGIPATDLASAVQTSLGKADTALQSYTETDPTVPSWAKAQSKPTYTASEVGAIASDQGVANAGKFMVVGNDGVVTPVTMSVWAGGNYGS
ncbi:MAG: tail fiber protein [Clostridia bacterium]|nr:tail fiber protein [Clostridia bacterium]